MKYDALVLLPDGRRNDVRPMWKKNQSWSSTVHSRGQVDRRGNKHPTIARLGGQPIE
jgi:hypothetical protein